MMVTFISQCEKKALSKTRRVLDAFANRIGDNTWQTVITDDGLLTVKKMLRRTASKNTAVSCHWVRSRSRSQFLWVVGNKRKFDIEGRVPVNTTEKEVPMDIVREKPIKGMLYANTHLQRLDHHLFAVGYIAEQLYLRYYPNDKVRATTMLIAGCLHDIGKIDPEFQAWAVKDKNKSFIAEDGQHIEEAKFNFEKHPRHNEISLALYALLDDSAIKSVNGENKKRIKHAIFWHHAKPFRPKGGFETVGDIYRTLDKNVKGKAWTCVVEKSTELIEKVCELDSEYRDTTESMLSRSVLFSVDPEKIWDVESLQVPDYKEYRPCEQLDDYRYQTRSNAVNNQLRACLITADRWVSSLSANDLASAIKHKALDDLLTEKAEQNGLIPDSNLESHIADCLRTFPRDKRGDMQSETAQKLSGNSDRVGVLAGAAGCGKTKIALEWAKLRGAKQILWVCPRVQICQGLFAELSNSDTPYLPNATIELHTGEFKCVNTYDKETDESDYFSGDIVITTIDQLLNTVISHTKADSLLNYLGAHIVFDEFHEYINMPAFSLLFAELVASRNELAGGCNALLVSATPHYLYLDELLELDKHYDVVEMPSFNPCKYQFQFFTYDENKHDERNPLYQPVESGTFVISNTAITAQKSFVQNQHSENAVLLHSKYKKSDKRELFESVYESFCRSGAKQYDVLRSGPIVQASLNITSKQMVSEVCNAENNLQRLGRLDRFGSNLDGVNKYIIAIPDTLKNKKRTGRVARFMSSTNILSSALAWHEFLLEATDEGEKVLTLPEIYSIYRDFYENLTSQKCIAEDLVAAMKKSVEVIANKASEPKVIARSKKAHNQRAKISKISMRGDSRFVQMAVCDLGGFPDVSFLEEYAYRIPISESDTVDNLTSSSELIQGYGDSSKNLLAHMHKKHHNIMGGKKSYKDFVLLNEAVDAEFPVFLSYTPNDLLAVGGEAARHSEAIYYGICDKQPIGAISIKQFNNQKD
ncbi:CRISPR-associated endonuclease Cas3'' [Teredinibacter franksiae]|uniref:CRISPR-associated endonuclease Cas3'' n=1 Tax=Teredinibacter franksiae TaxID=2761453 RepID=UPI001626E2C6|nr:CRISPR-associated endonuclease Cas3'' [Teredinibacter franksiae]